MVKIETLYFLSSFQLNMIRVGFGVTVLARCLDTHGVDGIGSYTLELMKRLKDKDEVHLTPMSFGYTLPPINGVSYNILQCGHFPSSAVFSALTGLSFSKTHKLSRKIDLMHSTDHLIPKLRKVPVVATIMDAIPLSHPEWVKLNYRVMKNVLWKRSAQWADHVITISEYSKQEIISHFDLSAEKISVIPLGVDERWFHPVGGDVFEKTLRFYGLPKRFFLFVGTLQPRKNIARVIDAHRSLPCYISNEIPLVIVGRAGWQCDEIVASLSSGSYGKSIVWLKHLPDSDLLTIVKAATALVFPSLSEGFGLPVLEAFAAGTAVITSNCTSLPEVAGDAALLVDPFDTVSIAEAMLSLVEQSGLADVLIKKGNMRAKLYSWDSTVSTTLGVYKHVLGRT